MDTLRKDLAAIGLMLQDASPRRAVEALEGEIRNLAGGEVEAIVEGPKERIEEFISWCRRGPPAARVGNVEVRWGPAKGEFRSFIVTG